MNYDELKNMEKGYLTSNNSTFRIYGKVLKYMKDKYNSYSKSWLSDDMLFSEIASNYIEKCKHDMAFVEDKEEYKLKIRFASQFVKKDFLSKSKVKELLDDYRGELSFEKVREYLEDNYQYSRISPKILEIVISEKIAEISV